MRVEPIHGISSVGAIKPVESVASKPKVSDISFVNIVKSIADTNKPQKTIRSSYQDTYTLDISTRGLEAVKQYENDYYPIVNSDIFSYTKDLKLIYKD